jgi:Arc/MetJ family transcription regulator
MRVHIQLEDELVAELDERVGPRRRSAFVAMLIRRALDDEKRWDDIESALAGLSDEEHPWDGDPKAWVRSQRRSDARRTG